MTQIRTSTATAKAPPSGASEVRPPPKAPLSSSGEETPETPTPKVGASDIQRTPSHDDTRKAPTGTVRAGNLAQNAELKKNRDKKTASKAATDLYQAMHGGVFGWGTDEAGVYKALEGKTPEQIDAIRKTYKDHYNRDLDADIKSEMGGHELERAQNLLKGDKTAADAAELRRAMDGFGTDEEAIHQTLKGKSAGEIAALEKSYKLQFKRDLDADLKSEMGGTDLKQAQASMKGDTAGADAAKLKSAMDGLGTDEAKIFTTLEGKSAKELKAIEQRYLGNLRRDLKSELGGTDLDRAMALLDGRKADADAAKLEGAMRGLGTDEAGIEATLKGKTDQERADIAKAFKAKYGRTLDSALKSEMSGDDLARSKSLLKDGKLSDAERLNSAMKGFGTDEAKIHEVLEGRSKEEIAKIKKDYASRYGRELKADLRSELSGRDWFDTEMNLRGKATTEEEALSRLNERHAFERGKGNGVGNFVMDSLSCKGELLDRNHQRANAFHSKAMADGKLDASERSRLAQLTGYGNADVGTYRDAKDTAADTAGTVAATAAGVAVVVGTAGTATPLVATALGAAGAGAVAKTATVGMIQGRGYGGEAALGDAAMGAVDGAATAIGMRAGQAVAQGALKSSATSALRSSGIKASERTVAHMSHQILSKGATQRMRYAAIEGAVDGAIGGGLAAGGTTALSESTWKDGVGAGLAKVGQSTALGVGLGTAGGTLGGAVAGRNSTRLADELIDGLPLANTGGRRGVVEWSFRDVPLEQAEAMRKDLLRRKDLGAVHTRIRDLGVDGVDREMLQSIKKYNFDSSGLALDKRNMDAWNRLAQGKGSVADAQYIVHEAAEIRALRETGFDFMGKRVDDMRPGDARRWARDFDDHYMGAHRKALEAEYDFLARKVEDVTNGRVKINRFEAAAADRWRSEGRDLILADGVPMMEHAHWAKWSGTAGEVADIGTRAKERLGLGYHAEVTVEDVVTAVRQSAL